LRIQKERRDDDEDGEVSESHIQKGAFTLRSHSLVCSDI